MPLTLLVKVLGSDARLKKRREEALLRCGDTDAERRSVESWVVHRGNVITRIVKVGVAGEAIYDISAKIKDEGGEYNPTEE